MKECPDPEIAGMVLQNGKTNIIGLKRKDLLHISGNRIKTEYAIGSAYIQCAIGIFIKTADIFVGNCRKMVSSMPQHELTHAGMIIAKSLKKRADPDSSIIVGKHRGDVIDQRTSVGQ